MTSPVLVLLDHTDDGTLRTAVPELTGLARAFGPVHGVWVTEGTAGASAVAPSVAAELGRCGVEAIHVAATGDAHPRLTPVAAEAVAFVADAVASPLVLLSSSFENKEIATRTGVLTGAGVVVDATGLALDGDRVVADKQVFTATWSTRCAVRTPRAVITVKPHAAAGAVPAPSRGPQGPRVVLHDVAVSGSASGVRLVERVERAGSGRPDLATAQIVVVGGRGTGGDFQPVEDLAELLGGAVGATRVVTDEGWYHQDALVGQTGVTVSPRLYVGAGVSGAVHHRGGMQSAERIVAVDTDPDAPIFEIADFGVVGDLRAVLPQAVAELRRLLAR